MVSQHTLAVAQAANQIYDDRLRSDLEADHLHEFVAIEPDSGQHFLGGDSSCPRCLS